jgi:hypothetical protein
MCDYSLHAQPNRLAEEGESLVVHRFPFQSIGLASPTDLSALTATPKRGWLSWLPWLQANKDAPRPSPRRVPAVCIPPGAKLTLRDIPQDFQKELAVKETEEVRFEQLSASEYVYRDAVRFSNGRVILLQRLAPGQRVGVLSLGSREQETIEIVAEEVSERVGL